MYILPDISSEYLRSQTDKRHNYIIISTKNQSIIRSGQGYVQCMCITSQKNHDVYWEVPIVMPNGTIGYVVPYNLFSYDSTEFQQQQFRGYLSDTDWGTCEDFIELLMEIYMVTRKIGPVNRKKVEKRLKKYNKWFSNEYADKVEYRDITKSQDNTDEKEDGRIVTPMVIYRDKSDEENHYDYVTEIPVREWSEEQLREFTELIKIEGELETSKKLWLTLPHLHAKYVMADTELQRLSENSKEEENEETDTVEDNTQE